MLVRSVRYHVHIGSDAFLWQQTSTIIDVELKLGCTFNNILFVVE